MDRKVIDKAFLLSLMSGTKKKSIAFDIIMIAAGTMWLILSLFALSDTGVLIVVLMLPLSVGLIIGGILMLRNSKKDKDHDDIVNDRYEILALPVIGREEDKGGDVSSCFFRFPFGIKTLVGYGEYLHIPDGAYYYIIYFTDRKTYYRQGYSVNYFTVAKELMHKVKMFENDKGTSV